jgi:hypothetical protein
MKLALVTWRDAHSDAASGWTTADDIAASDDGDYIVWSVGWLLQTGDAVSVKTDHVSVAQSLGNVTGSCESQTIDSVLHIPVENVLAIRVLLELDSQHT